MKYGVIVCPKCGMAKGVEAAKKTTTCQCGREIELSHVRLQLRTDSPLELAKSVADANASIRGGKPMPTGKKRGRRDAYSFAAEAARQVRDPIERVKAVSEVLTKAKGEFTMDDLRRVATILGKEEAEDLLARLLEHNLVYETSAGVYRAV